MSNNLDKTKNSLKRKRFSGKISVPAGMRALIPKDVSCIDKNINGYLYGYKHSRKEGVKNSKKNTIICQKGHLFLVSSMNTDYITHH